MSLKYALLLIKEENSLLIVFTSKNSLGKAWEKHMFAYMKTALALISLRQKGSTLFASYFLSDRRAPTHTLTNGRQSPYAAHDILVSGMLFFYQAYTS